MLNLKGKQKGLGSWLAERNETVVEFGKFRKWILRIKAQGIMAALGRARNNGCRYFATANTEHFPSNAQARYDHISESLH